MVRVGRVQRRGCVSDRGYYGSDKRLEAERGLSPMEGCSVQVACWALRMINTFECSLNLRRQRLSDNIGIQAPEVLANRAQKLLIRHYGKPSTALDAASHRRLQITATEKVPRHAWGVNHLFMPLWITGTIVRFLAVVACLPSTQLDWALRVGSIALRKIPSPSFGTTAIGAEPLPWLLRAA